MPEHTLIPDLRTILSATPVRVFKSDARSRVWLVECGGGRWVVKQFLHNPLRQRVALLFGSHPGQREARRAGLLARETGLRVARTMARGMQAGRYCVITEYLGDSLQIVVARGAIRDVRFRRAIARQLAEQLTTLTRSGWFLRDYQAANLVLDQAGMLWLIDVGSARRARGESFADRMAALLLHTLLQEGASRTDLGYVLREALRTLEGDTPSARERARRIARLAAERATA